MALDKKKKAKQQRTFVDPHEREGTRDEFKASYYTIPEGMYRWRPGKPGIRRVDVMAFPAGPHNPGAPEGTVTYERTAWVHQVEGVERTTHVCRAKTFGERCPWCEDFSKQQRKGIHFDNIKHLRPKERQIFLFKDVTNEESKKDGYGVYEASHFKGFGERLKNKLKGDDRGKYKKFYYPDAGKTLKLTLVEDKMEGGKKFTAIGDIEFEDRDEQYDQDVVDEFETFDTDLIPDPGYDALKKIFLEGPEDDEEEGDGEDQEEGEEEESPKKKDKKKKPEPEEEEEEESDDDEEGEEEDDESGDIELEEGCSVRFKYKGKTKSGVVDSINQKKKLLMIQVDGEERLSVVSMDDETLEVIAGPSGDDEEEESEDEDAEEEEEESEEEEEEESEEEEEEEEPKKKGKGGKKKPEPEEEEEEEEETSEDDDWDSDDADDSEEEEEEDDEPPAKKKGQRRK